MNMVQEFLATLKRLRDKAIILSNGVCVRAAKQLGRRDKALAESLIGIDNLVRLHPANERVRRESVLAANPGVAWARRLSSTRSTDDSTEAAPKKPVPYLPA